jgi:hypothetical protein
MNDLHRERAPRSTAVGAIWRKRLDAPSRSTLPCDALSMSPSRAESGSEVLPRGTSTCGCPDDDVIAHVCRFRPLAELRVPFSVDRRQVDDVAQGAKDANPLMKLPADARDSPDAMSQAVSARGWQTSTARTVLR